MTSPTSERLTITVDNLVTDEAEVTKELMVVQLAVGLSFLLVVPVAEERFLTLHTHEVLHVPVLPQRSHDTLLDGPATRPADGDAHLVVATEAVQFVLRNT